MGFIHYLAYGEELKMQKCQQCSSGQWDVFSSRVLRLLRVQLRARPAAPGAPQALQGEEQRWGGEWGPLNSSFLEDFKMNKDWCQTCGKA